MATKDKRYVGFNDAIENDLDLIAAPTRPNGYGSEASYIPEGYVNVNTSAKPTYKGVNGDNSYFFDDPNDPRYGDKSADAYWLSDEAYSNVQGHKQKWGEYTDLANQARVAGNEELAAYYDGLADNEHLAAENERMYDAGYAGGADGSGYFGVMTSLDGAGSLVRDSYGGGGGRGSGGGSGFGYDPYLSKYQARIDALADAILNRDPFSYDKNKDPLYQQYEESYTRGGQRGMQDTLAQVSARTGGLASSYAETAAQQTYNNYMAELANKVPELYQLAYSMYMDDLNQDRADLSMLQGLDDTAYGRWSDALNFDYGMYRDGVADSQWQQQFDYNAQQDALAQQNWQSQFDYQKQQDALAQQNWQTQWDYQVQQDALAREDALRKLLGGGTPSTEPAEIEEPTYTGPGGIDLTDTRGSNYQDINTQLQEMVKGGASSQDIRDAINEARDRNLLTETDYQRLVNKYR